MNEPQRHEQTGTKPESQVRGIDFATAYRILIRGYLHAMAEKETQSEDSKGGKTQLPDKGDHE